MSIEEQFDIPFVSALALREKQIQQNYRPIIAVHKWFARRPGTLFRALLLSEFCSEPLSRAYYKSHDLSGRKVADPFMGGGTPLIEANRLGCDVLGMDINPMAAWIVKEEIEYLNVDHYLTAATAFLCELRTELERYYVTRCPHYGTPNVPVKYFLWVKILDCDRCSQQFDLFPGYLVAEDKRHPQNVVVCASCGELNEVASLKAPGICRNCSAPLKLDGPAKRNRCSCPHCGHINTYPRAQAGPPRHRLFAIEYFNPACKSGHAGRFFKRPDLEDLAHVDEAAERFAQLTPAFVPEQKILAGDETDRLHRWGYTQYRDLFNARQLLGLELSCRLIHEIGDRRLHAALATNLSDLLRYQNMLCRYDTMALKSLDIFSIHGFPVGLVHCESNLLGIVNGSGVNVGSGGWTNIIDKYAKAKRYCEEPFEIQRCSGKNVPIPITGEWIGEQRAGSPTRSVELRCQSATEPMVSPESLDAVFTDPPYFGNVQYGELMDFCYVWLRQLVRKHTPWFELPSSRSHNELTENVTAARGIEHFTEGLSAAYSHIARALKPGAPLAFTYHHNQIDAYFPIGMAILDAGLNCFASLPCPAEMGGSIHIRGTGSSIIDTVFVCRKEGILSPALFFQEAGELQRIAGADLRALRAAGVKPTAGDIRCIVHGHLTRMAVYSLRETWDATRSATIKLVLFAEAVERIRPVPVSEVIQNLQSLIQEVPNLFADDPLFADKGNPDAVSV